MKQYLDIQSLIESDYYKKNKRLRWHIGQLQYDEFAKDLHDWLYGIKLADEEKLFFDISSVFIYTELASYLTHVYDYLHLTEKNIEPIYSKKSNIFINKIWSKETITASLLIELEKDRFKVNFLKLLYSFIVKVLPKNYIKVFLISENTLVKQYLNGIKKIYLKIIPHYYFKIDTRSSTLSRDVSRKVKDALVSKIEENYFVLNYDHKESIGFIVESFIARAYNNVNSYNKVFSGCRKKSYIITGTGNSYYNRLLSSISKKEGIDVVRFNHGGDRCFYDDMHFWENGDLFQTDIYITYGRKWKTRLEGIIKNTGKKITVKSIGSDYHKKIYNKFFNKKTEINKKILYIPNSFIGEIRVFPYAKIIDPILFDWQKYLIETLQKNGFEVIYKKHPKGFLHEENILGDIATYESTKPMIEALEYSDMVLCDMAGTAFIESLCAGKNIVLIDTTQRPFNFEAKKDLQNSVKIIEAYWENNILKIDEEKLVDAFSKFDINKDNMRKTVKDYFLNSK